MSSTEKILIVGGGFGGVKAALELVEDERFEVTLLSDDPDLRYYPTLYQTATGSSRANSSIPLNLIFANLPINIITSQAQSLDRKNKVVRTTAGQEIPYDSLIIGLGVVTNYFGIEGLAEFAYSIKSQSEVQRFKAHLHKQLTDDRRPDLNYVIVGAGPTGIELAGNLPFYIKEIMKNHGISDNPAVHVDLIEALPRLLPRMPKAVSSAVKGRLKKLGIKLYTGSAVQAETADDLTVNGKPIRSHTVIWTAGVTNHPFFKDNNFNLAPRGKVSVNVYLETEDNIFVIGDNANTPYSGLAQTAILDGKFVANNLKRRASGKKFKSYVAKEPVTIIPAGPHWAVVMWGKAHFSGQVGWLLRSASDLVGFHDYEDWPRAIMQFIKEFEREDDCAICTAASSR